MQELVAYRMRIYPAPEQQLLAARTVGCCRLVYNLALEQRSTFSRPGRSIRWMSQANELRDLKALLPFLAEVPHHCLQQALIDLDRAYAAFFEGRAGYPRPRSRWRQDSFRFPDPAQVKIRKGRIFLPKLKWVEALFHRPVEGKVKSVTVSREGRHWYASILVSRKVKPLADVQPRKGQGIDLNVNQLVATSDGEIIHLPRVSRGERKRVARLQRELARRTVRGRPSSNRRKRTRAKLAELQAKFARRRRDAIAQLVAWLFKHYDLIALEDLQVRAMTASARGTAEAPGRNVAQKAGLNRNFLDVSPGAIRLQAVNKALSLMRRGRNTRVVAVPPQYTSQTCSDCGRHPRDTAETKDMTHGRISRDLFACPFCGYQADADVNAARNILNRAVAIEAANDDLKTSGAPARLPEAHPAMGTMVAARGALGTSRAVKREQRSDRRAA